MAEVLLGVSGGIAAYKAVDVMRILQRGGHGVTVVMTRAARRFVGPATFAALSGRPVGTDLFGAEERPGYDHLELARRADLMLVVPGLGEHDRADGRGPRRRAARLGLPRLRRPRGDRARHEHAHVDPPRHGRATSACSSSAACRSSRPASGLLADGEVGRGPPRRTRRRSRTRSRPGWPARGPSPAGACWSAPAGTREPIDPVRYVGNRSSGRMGWAVADAARRRGAEVTVLASNVDLPRHPDMRYVDAPTAADLHARRPRRLPGSCDVLVMAAAVADFAPGGGARGQDRQGGRGAPGPRARADRRHPLGARRPPRRAGRGRLRRRARPRGAGSRAPRQARAQAPRPHRPQRRVGRGHRLRQRRQRDHDHRPGRGAGLPPHEQGRLRRAHPRLGSAAAPLARREGR